MKKRIVLSLILLIASTSLLFAQGTPGCDDPDGNCPLDTWVIGFAVLAVIVTTGHLSRKKKQQQLNY